jgi:hypothetical protein
MILQRFGHVWVIIVFLLFFKTCLNFFYNSNSTPDFINFFFNFVSNFLNYPKIYIFLYS